ncbi:MAG: succinate dehydrogenase cytochrome b subunit [Acidobacteria bacterium]|nr:succinate dehydrogenase cytochrome b subunit [Acidobacteriota bacterium]
MSSTVGTKFMVAATGAILAIFVLGHMAGNLQIFLGPDTFNHYAATLKGMTGPLWAVRLTLLAALVLHVVGNLKLRARNSAARPVAYADKKPLASTAYSRTMVVTGLILLAFIVYHLAHFTLGLIHPGFFSLTDAEGRHDAYSMVVLGFREPLVAIPYLIAMALLFAHLAHGVSSLFQSFGVRRPAWQDGIDLTGRLFAIVVAAGNIAIVLACLAGVVEPFQEVL